MSKDADQIELSFLEGLAKRLPENRDILKSLADLYTKVGRYNNGLYLDEKLSLMCPDENMVWYNLACSYALTEQVDQGINALEKALELGYDDFSWMKEDKDLSNLHGTDAFTELLKSIIPLSRD